MSKYGTCYTIHVIPFVSKKYDTKNTSFLFTVLSINSEGISKKQQTFPVF